MRLYPAAVQLIGLWIVGCTAGASPHGAARGPAAETTRSAASPSPLPSATGISPLPQEKIDAKTAASLRAEFKRQLEEEAKAFKKDQARELKDERAANKAKIRAWERGERDARHAFFEQNKHGPDRRAYIGEFLSRRDALYASVADEEKEYRRQQDLRKAAFEDEQRQRLKDFEEFLARSERPPMILWKK